MRGNWREGRNKYRVPFEKGLLREGGLGILSVVSALAAQVSSNVKNIIWLSFAGGRCGDAAEQSLPRRATSFLRGKEAKNDHFLM